MVDEPEGGPGPVDDGSDGDGTEDEPADVPESDDADRREAGDDGERDERDDAPSGTTGDEDDGAADSGSDDDGADDDRDDATESDGEESGDRTERDENGETAPESDDGESGDQDNLTKVDGYGSDGEDGGTGDGEDRTASDEGGSAGDGEDRTASDEGGSAADDADGTPGGESAGDEDRRDPTEETVEDWDDAPPYDGDADVVEVERDGETVEVDRDGEPVDADGEQVEAEYDYDADGGVASSRAAERPDNMAEATPLERTGPADDEEMPLAVHIEEMVKRLFAVIAVAGVVSVAVFPFGEEVINFLWFSILPGTDVSQPRVYHPLSLLLTQLKVASLAGLVIALPVFVYQTYRFMRPGLYPHERRYYLAAVPTSLVLAFVGITFAYFIVLPAIFSYFLYYSEDVTTIAFALQETFNLILLLMGYLAIVFQIPLFIMLAIMMNLTSRQWMEERRLYFWGGFLGVAFLFSPDPTGMAPFLVATTMVVLFEGTLLLLRWTRN